MFTTIDLNRTRNIRNFLFGVARMLGIRSRSPSDHFPHTSVCSLRRYWPRIFVTLRI